MRVQPFEDGLQRLGLGRQRARVEIDKPAQRRDQDRAFVIAEIQPLHYFKYGRKPGDYKARPSGMLAEIEDFLGGFNQLRGPVVRRVQGRDD